MNYLIETCNRELTITLLEISITGEFARKISRIISKTDKSRIVKVVVDLRLSERIEPDFFEIFNNYNYSNFPINFIGVRKSIPICKYL